MAAGWTPVEERNGGNGGDDLLRAVCVSLLADDRRLETRGIGGIGFMFPLKEVEDSGG